MRRVSTRMVIGVTIISLIALTPAVFAQSATMQYPANGSHVWQPKPGMAFGQITAINGNSLTVQGKDGKTYTVDATSATVTVNGQASTLSALVVGNQIMVRGQPLSSDATQITAQTIREGMTNRTGVKGNGQFQGKNGKSYGANKSARSNANQKFNQLLTVTNINGTTVTATGQDGVSYTVDLSNAKIVRKFGAVSALTEMSVGDSIKVFGPQPAAGTYSITASNVRNMSVQEKGTLVGTIQNLTGNGFTLLTSDNLTYNVTVGSTTAYRTNNSQTNPVSGLGDLRVGDKVRTFGLLDTAIKTDAASAIRLMSRT